MPVVYIENKMEDKIVNADVGMAEDMIFLLSNLVAIEDHSAKSIASTKNERWLEVLDLVRKMRTKYLSLISKKEESQLWCVNKHLLASIEGLIEVGNRFTSTQQIESAKECYDDSNTLLKLFLLLNDLGGSNGQNVSNAKSSA